MANLNIIIPEELHKKLKLQAIKEDRTLKEEIIRRLKAHSRANK